MELLSPEEIAKGLMSISWGTVQGDCVHENEKVRHLLWQLEQMDSKKALRLMLYVFEVAQLNNEFDVNDYNNPFRDMGDMKYLKYNLDSYPTTEDYQPYN